MKLKLEINYQSTWWLVGGWMKLNQFEVEVVVKDKIELGIINYILKHKSEQV